MHKVYRSIITACGMIAALLLLFWIGSDSSYWEHHHNTARKLNCLKVALISYADSHDGAIPPLNIRDMNRYLRMSKEKEYLNSTVGKKWDLKDGWGNELHFSAVDRQGVSMVTIRSNGPNGVDDDGAGDDIMTSFAINQGV